MCTLIISHDRRAAFPLLLAANRDEMLGRPWLPPGAHWPDQPDVIGGRDVVAGGSWLAVNRAGVVAGVLNRTGSLGPAQGKKSRGDLPLLALRHGSAKAACDALAVLPANEWRGFNLVIADRDAVFWLTEGQAGAMRVTALPPGVTMVTALDPNDMSSPRIARHLPKFTAAQRPEPPDWREWPALLADNAPPWEAAINLQPRAGFGTVSSALIGIGRDGDIIFSFAPGPLASGGQGSALHPLGDDPPDPH
jgi:hypothetical protein